MDKMAVWASQDGSSSLVMKENPNLFYHWKIAHP